MKRRSRQDRAPASGRNRVYELEACLLSGPVTEEFVRKNPVISRTIEVRGDQTLEQLHNAIFRAFDRWDKHMYELRVGGRGPMDRRAERCVPPMAMTDPAGTRRPAGNVARVTADALGLEAEQAFGYWFDFGDDWWHQISVVAIHDGPGAGKYPRVTAKTADSPPEYPDWDDEDEEEDDEE